MIYGVGIDLLEISRVSRLLQNDAFMRRVYTEGEREYIASKGRAATASAAAIFCAKEAVSKALGRGLEIPLRDIEVAHRDAGAPYVVLHGATAEKYAGLVFNLSLTHTSETAGAFVTAERL